MNTVAYLTNSFPEPGESYVWEEIRELRRRGQTVISCSFRQPREASPELDDFRSETQYVLPLQWNVVLRAVSSISNLHLIRDLLSRAVRGPGSFSRRVRALIHTFLGVYLAASLREKQIAHIHVHHGYFAAWAGMVAARILGATFSMTLHGSDLLVRADYLDCKLQNCNFCVTVSQFNRHYISLQYPAINRNKILVDPLGVDVEFWRPLPKTEPGASLSILSVGRLHAVKNHAFLLRACAELQNSGLHFNCVIAGEGRERAKLQELIRNLHLENKVELRGHVSREQLPELYRQADVVVLTSRSEGIPLTAMEAMAMERIVLAPEITGIPELISHEKTGFLYQQNSLRDFLAKLNYIHTEKAALHELRLAARRQIERKFNRDRNLQQFSADFLRQIEIRVIRRELTNADPLLQQI